MKIKVIIYTMLIMVSSGVNAGGYSADATVDYIGVGKRFIMSDACNVAACVVVAISPVPTGAPSCARHSSGWHYMLNTSTDVGKQAYSALLMAQASNRKFDIEGTGACIGNGYEEILYVVVK